MPVPNKPDFEHFQQLALGLNISADEVVDKNDAGWVSPEEARRRSEAARQALEVRSLDETPWMQDYMQLRDAGWPWRVAAYIAWAGSPKKTRWPKNQDELARQVLGLTSDRQIYVWRGRNPAIDEVIAAFQAAPLYEHRADIYDALIKSATNPDYKNHNDRELALKMLGDYVPRQDLSIKDARLKELDEMTDEELIRLAGSMNADGRPETGTEDGDQGLGVRC
jgi:hypothetical protein